MIFICFMNILKIPHLNGLSKTEGCEKAPEKILDSLEKEFYSNENGKEVNLDNFSIQEFETTKSNAEKNSRKIYEKSLEFFKNNQDKKAVFLGGDHSISCSIGRAFFEDCINKDKSPCLIVFDAHPDLMPVPEGNEEFPSHEEWLRGLIEEGFPVENILLVGVRNSYKKESDFIKEKGINCLDINYLSNDIEDACDFIMEFTQGKELYVSFDIDVIDPVFAPGTGYKETGGLTSRQGIYLIQRFNKMKNLRAFDLVEINPDKDRDDLAVRLGAKILSELI